MSGFQRILDFMRLNDDYYDDDYDEEEVVTRKPKQMKPKQLEDISNTKPIATSKKEKPAKPVKNTRPTIVPISSRTTIRDMEVCIVKPAAYDEVTEITDVLLGGRVVVVNLEGIDVDMAQRIVDFVSGSCYAMRGNIQKISNYILIITPENIDISGDFQDMIAEGFEMPTLNSDF